MTTQKFVLPRNNSLGVYFVTVTVTKVNFIRQDGKQVDVTEKSFWKIGTDMQFNPLQDRMEALKGKGSIYFSFEEAMELLAEFNRIQVKDTFDTHDIDDLNEIKSELPAKWIEKYNSLHEMKIVRN